MTSALIQLGWTFILRKPTIIFHECPKSELPKMISQDSSIFLEFIKVIKIDSVTDIMGWLEREPKKWWHIRREYEKNGTA